ncbi:hypothetical protein BH23PLA1_BH23PLA1_09860 [soil metagenome]
MKTSLILGVMGLTALVPATHYVTARIFPAAALVQAKPETSRDTPILLSAKPPVEPWRDGDGVVGTMFSGAHMMGPDVQVFGRTLIVDAAAKVFNTGASPEGMGLVWVVAIDGVGGDDERYHEWRYDDQQFVVPVGIEDEVVTFADVLQLPELPSGRYQIHIELADVRDGAPYTQKSYPYFVE